MIEPAAYGAAVVFGPHVWNFRDTVDRLLAEKAAIQVADAAELEAILHHLAGDTRERVRLGTAAQRFVLQQQGATARTLELLDALLAAAPERVAA
jgi:3-deoxy-D-manno-octulosonic-acid transferase